MYCHRVGSVLYERLLERAATDVEAGGPCWSVFRGHERSPRGSALPLRFMGSLHRLVLEGHAEGLARHYPSVGGDGDVDAAVRALIPTVVEHSEALPVMMADPVQTNEVGRSAALLGGFLLVADRAQMPLRILEVGASAGLNLLWDRYRYQGRDVAWGDPGSAVKLDWDISGGHPPTEIRVDVAERRGCDVRPVDPTSSQGTLALMSFVWADRPDRLDLLQRALEVAGREPALVERADAGEWLRRELGRPALGVATIVFHSLVTQFMPRADRWRLSWLIQRAGHAATPDAPLAWLRMEDGIPMKNVVLTQWPGGRRQLIARAGLYGRPIEWLAGSRPDDASLGTAQRHRGVGLAIDPGGPTPSP
jgi:hypothetical protein